MVAPSKFIIVVLLWKMFHKKNIFLKKEIQIALPFTPPRIQVEKTVVYISNCHTAPCRWRQSSMGTPKRGILI